MVVFNNRLTAGKATTPLKLGKPEVDWLDEPIKPGNMYVSQANTGKVRAYIQAVYKFDDKKHLVVECLQKESKET